MPDSPIKDVPFGEALKVSLNNYYDLLKNQVGGLATEEYLQLKLVADAVDVSEEKYKWFSYYNLLRRSDQAIKPTPVTGVVMTAASDLVLEYERFLRQLRSYVVRVALTADEQKQLAELDLRLGRLRSQVQQFAMADRAAWKEFAELMGYAVGDKAAYVQWSVYNGHLRDIENLMRQIREAEFDKKTILDRQYPEPTDREVIDAEFDFENPVMRLRYPIHPDFEYPDGANFNVTYLALLPLGNSALFDDRRVVTWDKTLGWMKTAHAGRFAAAFDRTTSESKSIDTDWGGSSSASYGFFIKVNANASDHTQITEDFRRATKLDVSAAAAFKVAINYPKWFRPTLFEHKRVVDNPHDFEPFFGAKGTLLYVPSHLILVRGFKVEFTSSQNWTFDYKRRFSASGGGGINVFGISFGGSGGYTNETKEHKVDSSATKLTIEDDAATVRFVGYAVKKNTVMERSVEGVLRAAFVSEGINHMTAMDGVSDSARKTESTSSTAPRRG